MNKTEYLLTCLAEECAEIQKEIAKAQRFGLNDRNPNSSCPYTNGQRISFELADFIAVWELVVKDCGLQDGRGLAVAMEKKKDRVIRFMDYSRERGCLEVEAKSPTPPPPIKTKQGEVD